MGRLGFYTFGRWGVAGESEEMRRVDGKDGEGDFTDGMPVWRYFS